ncbi:capsular biosynthesis protein, partial [Escherichia coli]|nr:capsular biosynthesis protein [Escherichia coli]
QGFSIILNTSRNMNSYQNNIGLINKNTLPVIINWLDKNDIPYDEIYVGKPWCGHEGFYVDDKAIRPSEFVNKTYEEIVELLGKEK